MDEQYIKDLYSQLGSEDVFGEYEDFVTLITTDDSYIEDVYNNFGEKTLGKFDDFKSLVKKQEQLTEEMMETGQRDAAPAYAMTEEKYAAEKKSPTESPSQSGASADVVEGSTEGSTEGAQYEEITQDLVSQNEESVVPKLNELYGDDFEFEEAGAGYDSVLVKSKKTGNKEIFTLDAFTDAGDVESVTEIKEFMRKNTRKTTDELREEYDSRIKEINRRQVELDAEAKEVDKLGQDIQSLAENGLLQESDERYQEYLKKFKGLEIKQSEINSEIETILPEYKEKFEQAPIVEKKYFSGEEKIFDALPVTKQDIGDALSVLDSYTDSFKFVPDFGDFMDGMGQAVSLGEAQGDLVTIGNKIMSKANNMSSDEIQKLMRVQDAMNAMGQSREMQKYDADYEEAIKNGDGWFSAWIQSLAKNPQAAAEMSVSSMAAMVNKKSIKEGLATIAAGGAAGFAVGGPAAPLTAVTGAVTAMPVAMGIAGATVEVGISMADGLREEFDKVNEERKAEGKEPLDYNEENIRKVLSDKDAMNSVRNVALTRGATIGVVDAFMTKLGAKIGGKIFLKTGSRFAQAGFTAPFEMAGEGVGEASAQVLSKGEIDIKEVLAEMSGGAYGTVTTMAASVLEEGEYKVNGSEVKRKDLIDIIDSATPEQLEKIEVDIVGDKKASELYRDKMEEKDILDQIPDNVQGESRQEALDLEKERKKLKNSGVTTFSKEKKISEINEKLRAIYEPDTAVKEEDVDQVVDDAEGPVDQAEDAQAGISDYISELDTKARTELSIGETLQKVNDVEEVNEAEIDGAIDSIFKEIDRVNNSDASQQAKDAIITSLYETAEQLDNYEFTTETRTKTVTKSRTVENLGAAAEKVSVEGFFKDAAGTINGEETVKFSTDGGVVKATRQDGSEFILDTPNMTIEEGGITFDTDGNLESVTVTDKQGNKVSFTGETAMDLAIKQRMNEIGSVPDAALKKIITEEVEVTSEELKERPEEKRVESVSGVEITYPNEAQKKERIELRTNPEYIESTVDRLTVEDTEKLGKELEGEFGILTAENPMAQPLTEQENAELNEKGEQWLKDRGYEPRAVTGKYEQAENSFFVPDLTFEDAIAFAKEFNQDSVAHSEGLVHQDGLIYKRVKKDDNFSFDGYSPESNYVSIIKTDDGLKTFGVGYDFSEKVPREESTVSDEIQKEVDAFNDLIDGKKARLKKGEESVSPEDYVDVEAVTEEMNQADPMIANYETPRLSEAVEVNPIEEASDTSPIPKEILDFYGVKSADELVVSLEDFNGMPMVRGGMSDMLASGTIKDSEGKPMKVGGGVMFSLRNSVNKALAWAGINKDGAEKMHENAVALYERNKDLFDRLWKEGRLPKGHVPMVITRMDNTAVLSNEAVFRSIAPSLKKLPKKNRRAAFELAIKKIQGKERNNKGDLTKALNKETVESINKLVDKYSVTTLDGLFDAIVKDANVRSKNDKQSILALDQRSAIVKSIFSKYNSNQSPAAKALFEGVSEDKTLLTLNRVYDIVSEGYMRDIPKGYVVAVVGIDVVNGGASRADHANYGYGPKGRLIGLVKNPRHQADIFPEITARAAMFAKKGEKSSAKKVLGEATDRFYNMIIQQGQVLKTDADKVDALIGMMRNVFPSVQAFTTKEEFDKVLQRKDVRTHLVDGVPVLGLTVDGKIYINPNVKSVNTPIHEFGHIWIDMLDSTEEGKRLLERGLDLVEEDSKAYEAAKEKYAEYDSEGNIKNDRLVREEALVSIIAAKGEGIVKAASESKFKSWIKAVMEYVKKNFKTTFIVEGSGTQKRFRSVIGEIDMDKVTVDEFTDMAIGDLFSGLKSPTDPVASGKTKGSKARLSKGIKATIDFRSRNGKTITRSREFNDKQHMNNYIKFMERKGNKEIGVSVSNETDGVERRKRKFDKKAVVNVGNVSAGTATLQIGVIKPLMIDGKEFATITKVEIPEGKKFPFSEMDLYERAINLSIEEGLGGVVIPKDVFNPAAIDENKFDVTEKDGDYVVTVKRGDARFSRGDNQLVEFIKIGRKNGISDAAIKKALVSRGFLSADIDSAMESVRKGPSESIKVLKNKVKRLKNNEEARALVAKELRTLLKDSGLSKFSKRTINKVITNLKNTKGSNMQDMLDGVSDAISRDRDRSARALTYKKRAKAIKKIAGMGALKDLQKPLVAMLKIDPKLLSKKALGIYNYVLDDLVNVNRKYNERSDIEDLQMNVESVIQDFSSDVARAYDISERVKQLFDTDKSVKKNLDEMKDAGVLSNAEKEVMLRFSEMLSDPTPEMTKEQRSAELKKIEEEARERIYEDFDAVIGDLPDEGNGFNKDERSALRFAKTLTVKDLDLLGVDSARRIVRGLEMLKAGIVSEHLLKGRVTVEGNRDGESVDISEIKESGVIDKMFSKIGNMLSNIFKTSRDDKGKSIESRLRNTPLRNIDQVLKTSSKKFKSTGIYKSIFNPTASAFSSVESTLKDMSKELQNANGLLSKNQNTRFGQKVKIAIYQIQREFESNPSNKEVNPAMGWVEATLNDSESIYTEKEKSEIRKIADKYSVDGEIDLERLGNDLTSKEKRALSIIDDQYGKMQEMAQMDAALQGLPFITRENYVHMPKVTKGESHVTSDFDDMIQTFSNPSLKSKALTQRNGKLHAVSFDPIETAYVASRKAVTSYHMYPAVKRAKIAFANLHKRASTDTQKAIVDSLERVYDSIVKSQFQKVKTNRVAVENVVNLMVRSGYLAQLASVRKAGVELASNATHAIMSNPAGIVRGFNTLMSKDTNMSDIDLAIKNLPTTEKTRLTGDEDLSSKDVESRLMTASKAFETDIMTSEIAASANVVKNNLASIPKGLIKLNENLVSKPDVMIARPLFIGVFNGKFKEITGQNPNWSKIANDQSYREKFDYAIQEATYEGDQAVVDSVASNNPFSGIPANIRNSNDSPFKQAVALVNRYMTRFRVFEYYSALKGIQNLFGKGEISRIQALGLLTATVTRMAIYKVAMDAAMNVMYEMLGLDEEEDEIDEKDVYRQVIGAVVTLAMGRNFGNLAQTPINFGAEYLNKEYGEGITRDEGEDYNRYRDNVTYSKIPVDPKANDDIATDAIVSSLGSYTPFLKTALRGSELYKRTLTSKKQETIDKNMDELLERIPFEVVGNLGVIPSYRDIRSLYLKDMFMDRKESKGEKEKKGGSRFKSRDTTR